MHATPTIQTEMNGNIEEFEQQHTMSLNTQPNIEEDPSISFSSKLFASVAVQADPFQFATSVETQTEESIQVTEQSIKVEIMASTPLKGCQQALLQECDSEASISMDETLDMTSGSSFRFSQSTSESEAICSDEDTIVADISGQTKTDSLMYVVFSKNLDMLFTKCLANPLCVASVSAISKSFKGSMATYTVTCCNNHTFIWQSQPTIQNVGLGNLMLSAATLYTGNTYTTLSEIAQASGIMLFSENTFYTLQRRWLIPTINSMWKAHQQELHSGKVF